MRLRRLLYEALGRAAVAGRDLPDAVVTGVAQHSARVEPGTVFVARKGGAVDGHRFVRIAIERGAIAVVGENDHVTRLPWGGVPYIRVDDDRVAVAKLAAAFHGHPSRALRVVGVTGTDGKTTTSFMIHHLLQQAAPTGLLSTAGVRSGAEPLPLEGHFTTPEATEVQALLAKFVAEGLVQAVVESSSHGLAAHRLDEVEYDLAVWTNLSPEHLDYHGTMDAYLEAKRSLVARAGRAVLNVDDPAFARFADAAERAVTYGLDERADWRATRVRAEAGSLRFRVHHPEGTADAELPMIGTYNVSNALAALAAAAECGADPDDLVAALTSFPGVPGRMQVIQAEPFAVVVDFAHTPTSLGRALQAVRASTPQRVIAVVGAAGERDPGKRRPMGRIAVEHADLAIFTEEDSRSEPVEAILAAMAEGAASAGAREGDGYLLVPDRRDAIRTAIEHAAPGDVVLLCGKGHEATLERADDTLPWNEADEAEAALHERSRATAAEPR